MHWLRTGVAAAFAIRLAGDDLIAPPEFRVRIAARRVFPFRFAGKPIGFLRGLRQPARELLRVGPTHVGDRGVIIPGGDSVERASLGGDAVLPLSDGDGIFADGERLDRDAVDRLFRQIVVTAHGEAAARQHDHLGLLEPARRCRARRNRRGRCGSRHGCRRLGRLRRRLRCRNRWGQSRHGLLLLRPRCPRLDAGKQPIGPRADADGRDQNDRQG
jgi:hypothetical protein